MSSHRCVCRFLEYNLLHEQVSPSFWCTQTAAAIWVPAHCQRFAAVWCTRARKCCLTPDARHRAGVPVFGMHASRPHKKGLESVTALFHPAGSCSSRPWNLGWIPILLTLSSTLVPQTGVVEGRVKTFPWESGHSLTTAVSVNLSLTRCIRSDKPQTVNKWLLPWFWCSD